MQFNKISKLILLLCTSLTGNMVFAQQAAPAAKAAPAGNLLEILMMIIAVIFCFVIWGMCNVLSSLGKQVIAKNKAAAIPKILATTTLLFLSLMSTAQQNVVSENVQAAANYGGMSSTGFWMLATVLGTEILVIAVLMLFIKRLLAELLPQKATVAHAATLNTWWTKMDKKLFTKAVPVEKEQDILLDHDYDGIRELDNALPPWWKYGFVLTIFVAVFYMLNFHVFGSGKDPEQEYLAEMKDAAEQKEIYDAQNADKVDEKNLQIPAAGGLAAGKEIFTTVCWACHGKQGEGGAGPNLTDSFWLHKGSLSDIYQSIKHGYPDKGMQGWEKNYSPKEINNLAGYIRSLKGTNPENAKAPQGDPYEEAADSSTVQTVLK